MHKEKVAMVVGNQWYHAGKEEIKDLYNQTLNYLISGDKGLSQKTIAESTGIEEWALSRLRTANGQEGDRHHERRKDILKILVERYDLVVELSWKFEYIGGSKSGGKEKQYRLQEEILDTFGKGTLVAFYKNMIEFILHNYKAKDKKPYSQEDIARAISVSSSKLSSYKNLENDYKEGRSFHSKRKKVLADIYRKHDIKFTIEYCARVLSSPSENPHLIRLARLLASNLIDVSTPFQEPEELPHREVLKFDEKYIEGESDWHKERFVLFAGAGASYAATKGGIPLGDEGAKEIRKRLIERSIPEDLINDELERLRDSYRLPPEEFETKLLAYSKFGRKEVIKSLRALCGYSHVPSLVYELIAHMLKHRFIDIVINFNYDEILDVAVREELQNGEYKFIFSDAHCPAKYKELLINDRLRQPVYIKPHGTVSHSSSLRFTQEEFAAIPPEIRSTIKSLIGGDIDEHRYTQPHLALNLIVVGYNITNDEYVKLLQEYLDNQDKPNIKIWVFDTVFRKEQFLSEFSESDRKRIELIYFNLSDEHDLESYLLSLWGAIESAFYEEHKPRGIERHRLINHIFNFDKDYKQVTGEIITEDRRQARLEYYKARFYVELVIALLQSDGLLNAKQILEDRAGDYFHQYLKAGGSENALRSHCERLGLKVYKDFVWDTYILEQPNLFYEKEELYTFLRKNLRSELPRRFSSKLMGKENKQLFFELCRKIRLRNIAKITPNFMFPHNHLFSDVKEEDILNTTISWTLCFQQAIKEEESWDLMLSISEKGRFLKQLIDKRQLENKRVELVLASNDTKQMKDLGRDDIDLTPYLLSGQLNFLPWWLHNRHMVLLMKSTGINSGDWKKDWRLFEGFFYESRMLSRRVNPVHVCSEKDLEILLYNFANYWYRARHYTKQMDSNDRNIPIVASKTQIESVIEHLLGLYRTTP